MRVVIITALRHGTASHCLPSLAAHPEIDVAMVIRTERQYRTRGRKLRRDLEKIVRIGPIGALVGRHLRSWYAGPKTEDLETVARREGVRYEQTPLANGAETVELMRAADADLGLSLGNGYLFPKVFRVPKLGTVNVHGEVLPEFRGGSSVIWPIYEGIRETGLTVHRMDERIDTGEILPSGALPHRFQEQSARDRRAQRGRDRPTYSGSARPRDHAFRRARREPSPPGHRTQLHDPDIPPISPHPPPTQTTFLELLI